LGVLGVISPWNNPLTMTNKLLFPALVTANSVVLKPSEETLLVIDFFVRITNEVLPEGVLQIAHGDAKTGKVLVDANIDKAAPFAVASSFENTSQICTFIERIYVDELIAGELEHKVVASSRRYQASPWAQNNVNIAQSYAACQSKSHYELPFIQPTDVTNITPYRVL
jgi:succinate-semialdehyde dehydrogenase/glutarate-semialdehyde dehydrogenase